MGNKITFECDDKYKEYLPWFYKLEENRNSWVKSMILKPTGLQPIKVVAIMPVSKENKIKADKYDFKVRRINPENADEKITIFFKKLVEKKKSSASAEISGELADSIETNDVMLTKKETKDDQITKSKGDQNAKSKTTAKPVENNAEYNAEDNMVFLDTP